MRVCEVRAQSEQSKLHTGLRSGISLASHWLARVCEVCKLICTRENCIQKTVVPCPQEFAAELETQRTQDSDFCLRDSSLAAHDSRGWRGEANTIRSLGSESPLERIFLDLKSYCIRFSLS